MDNEKFQWPEIEAAYHEAGHAVIAVRHGVEVDRVHIGQKLGDHMRLASRQRYSRVEFARKDLALSLAGSIAVDCLAGGTVPKRRWFDLKAPLNDRGPVLRSAAIVASDSGQSIRQAIATAEKEVLAEIQGPAWPAIELVAIELLGRKSIDGHYVTHLCRIADSAGPQRYDKSKPEEGDAMATTDANQLQDLADKVEDQDFELQGLRDTVRMLLKEVRNLRMEVDHLAGMPHDEESELFDSDDEDSDDELGELDDHEAGDDLEPVGETVEEFEYVP